MTEPESGPPNIKAAKLLLARLKSEITQAEAELAHTLADLRELQARVGGHQMMQLLEANENLVLDAMRLRRDAENSAFALESARRTSEQDALTGLPNRSVLIDRCAQAIAHARRYESRVALLFVDLDDFKSHNDRLGHAAGDQILIAVGQKMVSSVREVDTVCRLGGDEFVVLLVDVPQRGDPSQVVGKVLSAIGSIEEAAGQPVVVSASVGVSLYPDDGETLNKLIEAADVAMFRAKRMGGNRFVLSGDLVGEVSDDPVSMAKAEREERGAVLRNTNEQLVLSSMALEIENAAYSASFDDMERKSRAKDQFLAVLSHELRNPLAPIVSTLDALRLRSGGSESKELQMIRRHVTHMVRLMDDLLDVSKLSSGKVLLSIELVRIDVMLSQAIALARPQVDLQGHDLLYAPCDPSLMCRGDPVRLAQCVSNLLINAARYTARGGRIELWAGLEDQQVVIRVKDNGRGISEVQMAQIFEFFYQTQGLGTEAIGGLGIGLALVRSLIELQGGTVEGFSAGLGQGSEFTLRVPAIQGVPALAPAKPVRRKLAPAHHQRIVIVDDNQDAAESLAAVLGLEGHRVWTATHPQAAFPLIAQAQPQIIILDIGLPEMDGYQLAQKIRRLHPELEMSFVALSGYGSTLDRNRSEAERFDAHLIKPVELEELRSLIASLAARREPASRRTD